MIKPSKQLHLRGFTLVEMLLSMAIFGVLMAALGSLFISNSQATSQQISSADAGASVNLALLRMTEIIAQAHYIYPAEQSLSVALTQPASGKSTVDFVTGEDTLAVLIPAGTTFCPGTAEVYCGFVFSIENRSHYAQVLSANSATDHALVEFRTNGLTWDRDIIPANDSALTTWTGVSWGVLADSVVAPTGTSGSNLAGVDLLTMSKEEPIFDEPQRFGTAFSLAETSKNSAAGLILSVAPELTVRYEGNGSRDITRSSYIFSRAIPRGAQPNPQ